MKITLEFYTHRLDIVVELDWDLKLFVLAIHFQFSTSEAIICVFAFYELQKGK